MSHQKTIETADARVTALEAQNAELLAALQAYMSAVDGMNQAMSDGINVHGAVSALVGATDFAKFLIAGSAK